MTFSILKRIVMGETRCGLARAALHCAFSILKRIVMGETCTSQENCSPVTSAFSILKRIVMGETNKARVPLCPRAPLSVSSSGS